MKYKGTIGSDYSGKLGGLVASHNTYGTYFRRLVKPAQPRTAFQLLQRTAFATASQAWRQLPQATQQVWISAAPQFTLTSITGNPVQPTGQNLWMWCNALRTRLGLTRVLLPPATTQIPAITGLSFTLTGNTVDVSYSGSDEWNATGGGMLLSISPPVQAGRRFVNTYTALGEVLGPSTGPTTFILPFTMQPGLNLKLRASAVTPDGRRSNLTTVFLFPQTGAASITLVTTTGLVNLTGPIPVATTLNITVIPNSMTVNIAANDSAGTGTWAPATPTVGATWNLATSLPPGYVTTPETGTVS